MSGNAAKLVFPGKGILAISMGMSNSGPPSERQSAQPLKVAGIKIPLAEQTPLVLRWWP